ncbi:NAD-dependent succinate-semialdehyde dehydrogenase [Frigoriflavimonas asaccharolytica]|uniref:Succinate-semialdehyde dehydrogenase/glutarate-semialdehyde dehydrogenase n=1 Tax=Frigoriflavimonas asaccharolytica TaxID=2735899 RepID=A0A8J8K914_9FLAO|nr:NAD-dependent succinate-semialdehyde dehydrogenase [Frigoriflavimonas asaccharolytica]NRS93121.1 succinate-semialdehyde dehydrogenase/glutarate-semialdehyde dehydrogenase [Frigoriflavimonas asaccharolytica]
MSTTKEISSIKTVNPFNNEVVKEFKAMSEEQVAKIIDDADEAFKTWKNTSVKDRAEIMHKVSAIMLERKVDLGKLATLEMGKVLGQAIGEVKISAAIFEYYATNAEKLLADQPIEVPDGDAFLTYEPIGVILSVQPWNFPFYQMTRSAAAHITAGNTMVLKHASNVPQCAQMMEDIFKEAGLPEGVYTNLYVSGKDIAPIVANPKIKAVTLTGSKPAGASIAEAAAKVVKKSTLELGGSDPFIVLEDADVQLAVDTAVNGRMANGGQVCTSPKRIIVAGKIYDEFLAKTKEAFAKIVVGDPMEKGTTLGPLSSEKAAEDVAAQIKKAAEQGANIVLGGKRMERAGAFLEPTFITDITPKMDMYFEEVFGPVFMLYRYETIEDALEIANGTEFGLGGTVFGTDTKKAAEVARKIDSGMIYINHATGVAPQLPFGGTKNSGYGREQGKEGLLEFVNTKLIRTTSPDKPF